ncbi:hypothetical protein CRG98_019180 [Punica granatum]|uniref:Uncharacterized protein n=1 Tax=Punica granatum TaxID=22663 RepID=A0A2I0JVU8_PUNGR|nr:hypothetical protein CRG98_019180 [Punica granatum]
MVTKSIGTANPKDITPRWRQNTMHSKVESFEPFALANSRDKRIEPARSKTHFEGAQAKVRDHKYHKHARTTTDSDLLANGLRRRSSLEFESRTTRRRLPANFPQGFTPALPLSVLHTHSTAFRVSHPSFNVFRVSHPSFTVFGFHT